MADEKRRAAGRIGGLTTLNRYGRGHMARIGRLGGRPTWQESLTKAKKAREGSCG